MKFEGQQLYIKSSTAPQLLLICSACLLWNNTFSGFTSPKIT